MQQLHQGEGIIRPKIGLYYNKDGSECSDIISSYENDFKVGDEVIIDYNGDISTYRIERDEKNNILSINDYYSKMIERLSMSDPRSSIDYVYCVQEVVGIIPDRIIRAMVAHNLLIFCTNCNINTVFKVGLANINGEIVSHAYSLVSVDGKYYIFDSFYPVIRNAKYDPLVCEIDKKSYNSLLMNNSECEIKVVHDKELFHEEFSIIYNIEKEKVESHRRGIKGLYEQLS